MSFLSHKGDIMTTKKYGVSINETVVRLKSTKEEAKEAFMKHDIKHISVVNDDYCRFTIRHNKKLLDKLRKIKTIQELVNILKH